MMDKNELPGRAAEYFEQETKRRETGLGLGWHIALLFVLLTGLLIGLLGAWLT